METNNMRDKNEESLSLPIKGHRKIYELGPLSCVKEKKVII